MTKKKPLSEEQRKKKNEKDRIYRENKKKWQELVKKFCDDKGITEELEAFLEKHEEEVEQQRKYCEALGEASEALWENEASQDEGIRKLLKNSSKNLLETVEENLESEMIQTGGLEGVTAANSSSLGGMGTPLERPRELKRKGEELDGAGRGKRPATAYSTTPSPLPIGGRMVDAPWNHGQSVATQGPPLSTNKGRQIQMREATHDREASTSSWAPPSHHELEDGLYNLVKQYVKLKDAKRRQQEAAAAYRHADLKLKEKKKEVDNSNKQVKWEEEVYNKLKAELAEKNKISEDAHELQLINAVILGWNLKNGLLQVMPSGSEFLNMPLLDAFQLYPPLQNQYEEGLTLIGQGHPIDDKVAMQSDDPPVVVPRSSSWLHNLLEEMAREPIVSAPLIDAANSSQFQAANVRANNVEQEDNANDQRMDEATEADNLDWTELRGSYGGVDP